MAERGVHAESGGGPNLENVRGGEGRGVSVTGWPDACAGRRRSTREGAASETSQDVKEQREKPLKQGGENPGGGRGGGK